MKKYKRINPNRIHLITQGNDKPQVTQEVKIIKGVPIVMVKEAETK